MTEVSTPDTASRTALRRGRPGLDACALEALVHGAQELLDVEGLRERVVDAQSCQRAHVGRGEPAADHEYPPLELAPPGARDHVDAVHAGEVHVDDEQLVGAEVRLEVGP